MQEESQSAMLLERADVPESEHPPIGLTPGPPVRPADGRDLIFNFLIDLNASKPTTAWEAIRMTEQAIEMSGNGYLDRARAVEMCEDQCQVLHAIITEALQNRYHLDKDGNINDWWRALTTRYARFRKFVDYIGPFHDVFIEMGSQADLSISGLFS
jgi:hypothetical protein